MSDTTQTERRDHQTPEAAGERKTEEEAFKAGRAAGQNRWLLVALGAVTLIAGVIALAMPFLASITAVIFVGWLLIISGAVGLFAAFRRNERWSIAGAFALALLSVVAGGLVVLQPVAGIFAITTLIIAYFAAAGILRVYYGSRAFGDGGGWMIATGVLSLLLAVMLWFGLPFSAAWAPGILLGVDLLLWGATQIVLGFREGRSASMPS